MSLLDNEMQTIIYLMWNVNQKPDRSVNIRFDKSIFVQFYHAESACILIKRAIQSNEDVSTILRFRRSPGECGLLDGRWISVSTHFVNFVEYSNSIKTMRREKKF